jgi:hypothetical protein
MLATIREGLDFALRSEGAPAKAVLSDCRDALGAASETLARELSGKRFSAYRGRIDALCAAFDLLLAGASDPAAAGDAAKKIHRGLAKLARELETEREIKKEIVFFPYKASMWDSFESIWKAARADESCFVSVVPIPYYDRDGAGNFKTLHDEGAFFPKEVAITPHEEFDLAVISPDIAYIHNPYDDRNFVTSVHPDYYSRELKKHVKTLVYAPYYASDATPALSFASSAAALAADILIASSGEDAAAYRRAGVKYRIALLGSPKTDRILSLEKNKPEMPAEWADLKGKKIFFLNTSVASMLRFPETYFRKLQSLFSLFAGRDDTALLWRPHPLTLATIASMRPQLRAAYDALESAVRRGRLGLVDHSPDMGAAIALSDAYIGDGASSLVYLYALTGKPMYMLNFKMPEAPAAGERDELLKTDALSTPCAAEGGAWAFCMSVNALCRFDLASARAESLSSVPGEKNRAGLYGAPVDIGNGKLLLSPVMASEWAVYDTRADKWEKHPVPDRYKPKTRNGAGFVPALAPPFTPARDDFALFRPVHGTAFVKYDKAKGRFEYHTDWYVKFEPCVWNIDLGLLGACVMPDPEGDALFFTSPQGNILLELNMRSMKAAIHRVGDPRNRYMGVTYDGASFWLTKYMLPGTHERQNAVVRWNRRAGTCKEYPLAPVSFDPRFELGDFGSIAFFNKKVWVFPCGANEIFRIDPETEEIQAVETGLPYALGDRKSPYYAYADGAAGGLYTLRGDKELVFISYYDNSLLFIDADTGAARKEKLVIDGIGDLLQNPDPVPPYLYAESAFLTNGAFVEGVKAGAIPAFDADRAAWFRSVNANTDGSCGEKVHAFVMKHIGKGSRG